ncbi:MAG: selenocysteine-specific translation elongation factor [Acidimicrobiia bacterium]|nr:MAG: selenocysteine-specific translation elongation factor [Acidimicrobiia bacterium]
MPIVATAGHVDHGKSTLVEALTGRDPDRWAEEKERGLTIDLGYAWTDIDGHAVGFVDVPGHERFIKNMLAGVGAVDCALLVVAADSGWMPQTEEHAAVLSLLETRNGVIAVTRIDLVDSDTTELTILEILEEIEDTPLASWPVVPVSSTTGEGIEALKAEIGLRVGTPGNPGKPFRMWIDRSFTIKGAGLVVTGSVSQGSVGADDAVQVLPDGITTRVRGVHRHDSKVERAVQGDRAAVNLVVGNDLEVERGQLLVSPGTASTSNRFLAVIHPARMFNEIPKRGGFHVHIGTADTSASIRRVVGTQGYLVTTAELVPAAVGDRFILRDSGRRSVVGGGRILDPGTNVRPAPQDVETMLEVLDSDPDTKADALVRLRGVADVAAVALETGGGSPSSALQAGGTAISDKVQESTILEISRIVDEYHSQFPLRPGIGRTELASTLKLDDSIVDAVVDASDRFSSSEGAVHLAEFTNELTKTQEETWMPIRSLLEASFDVPRMSALDLPEELLHALVRRGDLVQIDDDVAFTSLQIDRIVTDVSQLKDGFTVSEFKEHFEMARRQAVPTLEWLDRTGVTRRQGDGRVARRRPS